MFLAFSLLVACEEEPGKTPDPRAWACVVPETEVPEWSPQVGCRADFDALASEPLDASISSALSIKTVIDRSDGDALYFMNSVLYPIHWDFASAHLSGDGLPLVGDLGTFNLTEYYSPDRRFILGAVTWYEGPDVFVYEISPYDTADVDMIATAYRSIQENSYFGAELLFHPTSTAVEALVPSLPDDIKVITTDELFAGIAYQPYNLGTTTGILRFHAGTDVDGEYTPFRELVVLDSVPNDISIVAGIITGEFQTPLAHINVLSQNRGTPNMGLRDAPNNPELLALEGKWVELTVDAFDWSIREITEAEADAWWAEHSPDPLTVQPMDLSVTDLRATVDILDLETYALGEAISVGISAFGAKATNYGGLETAAEQGYPIRVQPGFSVPMYYYDQFMTDNGLWDRIEGHMAEPGWSDPVYREEVLDAFQDTLRAAPMRPEVVAAIKARSEEILPGELTRFRSSTNSEDLGTFTGAGLYISETGDTGLAGSGEDTVEWAIKKVYAGIWNARAFEEREFYSIDHLAVGMGLLVHASFPEEESNGVAVTNNVFDASGLEPAHYVNAQIGDEDVVTPEDGVLPDAYLNYYYSPGQPVVYISHSSLVEEGETVLTAQQVHDLSEALDAAHSFFYDAYGADGDWYALECDFKFDDKETPGTPQVYLKQARPYPGWSSSVE